ncbi:uncharacterized protein MAM_01316 [Metarhizium album ARSEF 1941]|uniref:DUF6590 domain-containing protein n=1 Tax=Metarhizium album (strain ARSEF 1941) TaxID=1081103 RepID=A0A0B2X453_METAS|nr:uncharacterized protein MAM_01316 [Metarhizium album ARSEF 1941]KHO00538.1 hypothetical protein MAM_01316 [Metarhizium album ARSEF 1941]
MDAWGPWSAWAYDEGQQFMYRVRQDINGNLDYDYNYDIPRESGDVAGITQTLGSTSLSPSSSSYEQQPPGSPASHKEKERSKSSKSKSKDKERSSKEKSGSSNSRHYPHDKTSSHRKGHGGSSATTASHGHGSFAMTPQQSSQTPSYDQVHPSFDQNKYLFRGGYQSPETSYHSAAGSSYDAIDNQQALPQPFDSIQALSYGMGQSTAGPSDFNYSASPHTYEPEDDGAVTPRNHIAADSEDQDLIDPRYRVEHSSKFDPGAIFKVLWSEPQGSSDGQKHHSVSGKQERLDRFGVKFHVGFRRFIVIANDHGHCTCVPILTYGGRGCKKSGVKPNKHGIVYEAGQRPRQVEGEPRLGFPAVQVHLTEDGERLSRESRVNYSKLVTVEHNVSVFFIGFVAQDSWPIVEDAVNQCWDEKVHHRRPKHER